MTILGHPILVTLSPTVDLGQLLVALTIIASVIGAHFTIKARLDGLEKKFDETVRLLGQRLDRHEDSISKVSGHVQRLIGRVEAGPLRARGTDA